MPSGDVAEVIDRTPLIAHATSLPNARGRATAPEASTDAVAAAVALARIRGMLGDVSAAPVASFSVERVPRLTGSKNAT